MNMYDIYNYIQAKTLDHYSLSLYQLYFSSTELITTYQKQLIHFPSFSEDLFFKSQSNNTTTKKHLVFKNIPELSVSSAYKWFPCC